MRDIVPFGVTTLLVAFGFLVAVGANRLAERIRVPTPALFLIAATVASDLVPRLGGLSIVTDQRIVTVALALILFDGGMHIGWNRMRTAAGAVVWLGVMGTVVTAGALAVAAHLLFGFDWRASLLLGAALAPTDPAVVFAVLGRREIAGRTGTLLEGESGANDPVGIALMVSLLAATGGGWHAVGSGVGTFVLQMAVGGAVGGVGGWLLLQLMRHVPLPNESLYPVQSVAFALLLYGAATALGGSGFLAVFLTGIIVGDARAPYKRSIERFAAGLAAMAEIVAFVVLGFSVDAGSLFQQGRFWEGLALAGLLIVIVRPLLVGLLLLPIRLRPGERWFVLLSGLKGAVPIVLGTYFLVEGVDRAEDLYEIVFVVVLVSVLVQGSLVPVLAGLLRVPMREVEPEPWALGMRFRDEPRGLHRYVVAAGAPADGCSIRELDVGEDFWISLISRHGRLLQVRGDTVLQAGDEVLALADGPEAPDALFGR